MIDMNRLVGGCRGKGGNDEDERVDEGKRVKRGRSMAGFLNVEGDRNSDISNDVLLVSCALCSAYPRTTLEAPFARPRCLNRSEGTRSRGSRRRLRQLK